MCGFFGCLYAGVVAVPTYPAVRGDERAWARLAGVAGDCKPSLVLTGESAAGLVEPTIRSLPTLADVPVLDCDAVDDGMAADWRDAGVRGSTVALLQYTSGSTSQPRGVVLTHANVVFNQVALQKSMGTTHEDVGVSWLPQYHDMGLIGGVLHPAAVPGGFPIVLMSPLTFLKRPHLWLEAITRYRGSVSPAPNFSYDLCVRKVSPERRANLDLGSWRVALNGAEPVRASTLDRFVEMFGPCGFRRRAFFPCYGLAEATLIVSGGPHFAEPTVVRLDRESLESDRAIPCSEAADAAEVVACGRPVDDHAVRVVDPESLETRPDGVVGEILVTGGSVAQGYWNDPVETRARFGTASAVADSGGTLRTGDLGFLWRGELFVTGRRSDLITLRGRNLYPQDVESEVERCDDRIRPGCGAAFGVPAPDGEGLAIVYELQPGTESAASEVARAIRQHVAETLGCEIAAGLLVARGNVPKAANGKIQRRACREALLAGKFDALYRWDLQAPSHAAPGARRRREREIVAGLIERVARELCTGADQVDIVEPLSVQGLSSLSAATLAGEIEDWLDVPCGPTLLWEHPSIEALARHLSTATD